MSNPLTERNTMTDDERLTPPDMLDDAHDCLDRYDHKHATALALVDIAYSLRKLVALLSPAPETPPEQRFA